MYIRLISILSVSGILILALSACAPGSGMESNSQSDDRGLTGYTNSKGVPYTIGGDQRVFEAREKAPAKPAQPAQVPNSDVQLAQSISDVKFRRLNDKNKVDRFGTYSVRTQVVIKNTLFKFEGRLIPAGAHRFQTEVLESTPPSPYQAVAEFTDEPNKKYLKGKITFTEVDVGRRPLAKAVLYIDSFAAALAVTPAEDMNLTAPNKCLLELFHDPDGKKERSFAWVTNQVIDSAKSFYDIQIFAAPILAKDADVPATSNCPKDARRKAAGYRLFSFAGESLRTGDYEEILAERLEAGLLNPKSVILKGNAETSDERTFIAYIEGYQKQQIDFSLKILKADIELLDPTKEFHGLSPDSYFTIRYTDPKYLPVKAMIDDFEKNYTLPGVQAEIKKFLRNPAPLATALTNAHPFRGIINDIFHYFQVAPPASLVLMIESRFFTGGKYELQTNQTSSATGPFQLLWGSARRYGMRVHENGSGLLPPAWDERLYFVPSACGAAKHIQGSLEHFARHDRTLAILAYYQGDGGAAGLMQRLVPAKNKTKNPLKDIQRYRFTYSDIERQHMLPRDVRSYVNRSLALYFITGNPALHKFQWSEDPGTALPAGKVLPKSQMTDAECRQAVSSLVQSGVFKP